MSLSEASFDCELYRFSERESERELLRYMLSPVRLSSVSLS